MASKPNNINLIRTKASSSPQIDVLEASLRRSAYICLITFVSLAAITGVVYGLFYFQRSKLQNERQQLLVRVNNGKNKEGLLVAIKDRTKIVQRAMQNQKPWTKMFDIVYSFVQPPQLESLSVDEQNKMLLTIRTASVDEMAAIVDSIISYAKDSKILNPQLLSLQFGRSGSLEITVSFFAFF